MSRLFGTDGIRGLANEHPMTGEIALAVGRAVGHVLCQAAEKHKAGKRVKIVVGKDTRLSGYMLENALTAGLCSVGADVILIGPLPTPGVAFVTQSMRADAGIMISASHNPYYDNGIKIFKADGFKLPDEIEDEIEKLVVGDSTSLVVKNDLIGRAKRIDDVLGRYVVFLKALFPSDLDLDGMRVALDCANGATYKVAPLVFEELGAEVVRQGVSPNGLNINEKCGALYPQAIAEIVKEYRADIGIALDGDGDRCILTDEEGEIVNGDQIIGLCALQMAQDGDLLGNTVVTTPMSNIGLEMSLKKRGIDMLRSKVGDRYVVESMRQNGFNFGGEQSGHVIFLDHSTTGDGILAALKVLAIMRKTGKPLSLLKKTVKLYPQVQSNVRVSKKDPFEKYDDIKKAIEDARFALKEKGRVFVRYSGTEPVARVMVEGENKKEITLLAHNIAAIIKKNLS